MSVAVLIVLGIIECFFGARFLRLTVLVAGFGLGWMLAVAFDAGLATTLVVSVVAAGVAFVVTLLAASFVMFVVGMVVGAVVGAKLFVLIERGDPTWALAVVFIPAVALVSGFLATRFRRPFLVWATSLAGAALILSGIGRWGSDSTDLFWRPDTTAGTVVFGVAWVALTLAGRQVQGGGRSGRD
ncbi:DUF4203 domain-containing protein [Nocardioides guangzhouensis]|uniref:DUF4203 domain-containing protein n=1 Tax=Nocardioides guangzhouensis TaxID=2497878 RepID=A0A4Q4ZAS7_9ACTN|nr:DUF4203 domain-containing protein [Nocardioides guangzhouensis]RYP85047.1 DUF4203 domain-containing protein [Nocardioides guangzhouensis]